MNAHEFQAHCCENAKTPILNAACKEDPAKLGQRFGATNMDITTFDPQTNVHLNRLPNFVQGDLLKMDFDDQAYATIVVGEFLEHCVYNAALQAMRECHRVLRDDGELVVTYPLDGRPPGMQHGKQHLKVIVEGETGHDITVWHQTVWSEEDFARLLAESGFKVKKETGLTYGFIDSWHRSTGQRGPQGWGRVLVKVA